MITVDIASMSEIINNNHRYESDPKRDDFKIVLDLLIEAIQLKRFFDSDILPHRITCHPTKGMSKIHLEYTRFLSDKDSDEHDLTVTFETYSVRRVYYIKYFSRFIPRVNGKYPYGVSNLSGIDEFDLEIETIMSLIEEYGLSPIERIHNYYTEEENDYNYRFNRYVELGDGPYFFNDFNFNR